MVNNMLKDKIFLANLPNCPGIYLMLNAEDKVLYVGKARDLKKRVASYFSNKSKDPKTLSMLKNTVSIETTLTNTEHEALLLECFLIKKHRPHYNILLRDDKSYPYILITDNQPYPRITFYRGAKKNKGFYFGPYPNAGAVRETIHLLQKIFHLRGCDDNFFSHRKRPCLHYQIGLCSGSCVGLISPAEYQQNVQLAILFLKGKSQQVLQELEQKMKIAASELNYEFAAKLRDQIGYLEKIQERQYVSTARGNVDIIGLAMQAGIACIHLLSIRDGRLLGSQPYFPIMPNDALPHEILSAFISQHYLGSKEKNIPSEIIVGFDLEDQEWLEAALNKEMEKQEEKIKIIKPLRGERRKWLEMAESNAKQSLASRLVHKANIQERMVAFQQALNLKKLPHRVECFDVSHTMGEETVASCVVFNREGPVKSDYRRFNISGIIAGDDVAAMRQVLFRRFRKFSLSSKEAPTGVFPDVVLIDGGVTQLNSVQKVLSELRIKNILLVGVAKGENRKPGLETLYFIDRPALNLTPDNIALHFIQQIRDEAHRFAITGHRQRRDKKRLISVLEVIPGIGAKRRRALLKHFGGLPGLKQASLEQLIEVAGMNDKLAQLVYDRFHLGVEAD